MVLESLFFTYILHFYDIHSQAYDQHLNMILGNVEEIITSVEIDEETFEEIIKVRFYYCNF